MVNQRSHASDSKFLAVIHSYDFDYAWTRQEHEGIVKAINEHSHKFKGVKVLSYTLDSKKLKGRELEEKVSQVKKALIRKNLVGVMLTDDFAAQEFLPYLIHKKIPTSVAGINGNLENYGYSNNVLTVTGSLERYHLLPSIKILKKIRPTLEDVYFISDDSITGRNMLSDYVRQIEAVGLESLGMKSYRKVITNSYEKLQQNLIDLDHRKTILVLVAYYTFRDHNNEHVDYNRIDKWLHGNTQLFDIGSSAFQIMNGRLISLASSGKEVGYFSTIKLIEGIDKGLPMRHTEIRKTLPLELVINFDRARELSINIPYEIITYTKNVNRFGKSL